MVDNKQQIEQWREDYGCPALDLQNVNGNAFNIVALAMRALKHAGYPDAALTAYRSQAMAGSYDELIRTTMEWCDCSGDDD